MNSKEVMEQVPALMREDLYYYEKQGYIKPQKIRQGNKIINDYSQQDLQLIKLLHYYRQLDFWRGRTTRWAYEMALEDIKSGKTTPPIDR